MLRRVPAPREVLHWQATGRRCVSVLPDGADTTPHESPFDFAIHDLCHLDKFIDPEHHLGQRGFFAGLHAASARPEWSTFVGQFDCVFERDLAQVAADMNGSAVFLFAALKMRLKMAVRRQVNADRAAPREKGPLDELELQRYQPAERELFSLLGIRGSELEQAARATSARRSDREAASKVLSYFEQVGTLSATSQA
jgi:hypothetical protein